LRFLQQFDNILVYILLAAGFVKLMLGLWLDASIITGVVLINAILGFLQEGKAEKALDSIRNMLSAEARVRRDGEIRLVSAVQLAPGDIVQLESGDRVPADLRLIEVKNLRTEEAALTVESVPADKSIDPVAADSRRSRKHGLLRHARHLGARHGRRRGDWRANRARPHQSDALVCERAGNAASASNQGIRTHDRESDRLCQRPGLRIRPLGAGAAFR